MEIFVPGRLCLFGEHSDWAAQYRLVNPKIDRGYAIVVGTNQGIYARIKTHSRLRFTTINNPEVLDLPMDLVELEKMTQTGHFYSYVAGVAYEVLKRYKVSGVAIDNYKMDLPLKKGLSSSAAICVLVARAFNRLYDLGLSLEEEMDLAYWGERNTPSQCGRLDQACAYGGRPILMTFDRDNLEIKPLTVGNDLYAIIVDLAGEKNTQTILAELNQCYPVANNSIETGVQHYLGEINGEIVDNAILYLQQGNISKLGNLMNQTQAKFDRYMIPACPSQLTAPLLHLLLNHPPIQEYIYGGKGVGSQGDGTAQLIAKDRSSQQEAMAIIKQDFPQMQCFELNIS